MNRTIPPRSKPTRAAAPTAVAFALAVACAGGPARAEAPPAADFTPSAGVDLAALERLVAERAPGLERARLESDLAAAESRQAHLLGNPVLDATWGTIPIGRTPENVNEPLVDVPSYSVGLSYTLLLGKRGPRQGRAAALVEATHASTQAATRATALGLARVLGAIAASTLRLDGLKSQVGEQEEVIVVAKGRLAAGYVTPLDVDRLEIERSRVEEQVVAVEGELLEGLAACSAFVRARCAPFASPADARAFLTGWVERSVAASGDPPEKRPDVRALDAYARSAAHERDLASALAIPDPTVRVGYTHDDFVAGGAQPNSLSLSVSLPLTLFDHGQALGQAASARQARYEAQRSAIVATTHARVAALRDAVAVQRRRRETMETVVLPRARAVLADLQKAAANRLVPLTDVIQARRTVNDLLLQEVAGYADAFGAATELLEEGSSG